MVQVSLGIKMRSYSKIPKAKRTGGMAHVVECLPDKYRSEFKPQYCKKKTISQLKNRYINEK
jgi:hypothetical protein